MPIQAFESINASHEATGYYGRSDLDAFHIFTIEDTYPSTRQLMPPYRLNFYQMVLFENSADAQLQSNTERIENLSDTLSFASPEHVLAWLRGEAQQGYILFFKAEFLALSIPESFPFFGLNVLNVFSLSAEEKKLLKGIFAELLETFQSQHPYRVPILQAQLLRLLYECKAISEEAESKQAQVPRPQALTLRYQQFINQHFLQFKTVEAYANLLAISPDYLSQSVKAATGKTAYRLIAERILLEAKQLLAYSDLNISEIADYLGYEELSHFGRFFRRNTGSSLSDWRKTARKLSSFSQR